MRLSLLVVHMAASSDAGRLPCSQPAALLLLVTLAGALPPRGLRLAGLDALSWLLLPSRGLLLPPRRGLTAFSWLLLPRRGLLPGDRSGEPASQTRGQRGQAPGRLHWSAWCLVRGPGHEMPPPHP